MMPPGGGSRSTTIVAFSGKDRLREETVGPGLFEHWGLESGVL